MARPKKNQEIKTENTTKIFSADIELIIKNLQKKFGKQIIISPDDKENMQKLFLKDNAISTGNITIDHMTGIGGFPTGRIGEIYGKFGCGKTSICIIIATKFQQQGYDVLYIDGEHRVDLELARNLGMDIEKKFNIIRPDNTEHVFISIDEILGLGKKIAIVIDSIPSLYPKSRAEKAINETSAMAKQALEINDFLQRCNPKISKTQSILLCVNQLRAKSSGFGFYQGTTGGNALSYYTSFKISIDWDKNKDVIVDADGNLLGCYMTFTFNKTSSSVPPKPRKVCFKFGKGFWNELQITQVGMQEQIIEKNSSWLSYGNKKEQGEYNFSVLLENDKVLYKEIENKIKEKWGM